MGDLYDLRHRGKALPTQHSSTDFIIVLFKCIETVRGYYDLKEEKE